MNDYKIGQKVAYNTSRNYPNSAAFTRFGMVAKVTKTQIVLDNGMRFNENGHQVKSKDFQYPRATLMSVAYAEEILMDAESKKRTDIAVNGLIEVLNGKRSGDGRYHLTEETVAQIEELTRLIKG